MLSENCKRWPTRKLGEVCEIVRGVTFNKVDVSHTMLAGCTPILRAGNIQDELMLDDDLVWVPDKLVDELQILRVGDIAMCMSSGSPAVVGKTALLRREWRGSVGAFCGIIRPKKEVIPGYVAVWFRSPQYFVWRDEQARGANIQNLRASQVAEIEIPLPPLDEQRRIVEKLYAQMKEVEKMRATVDARIAAARALPSSFLRTVFTSPESQTWPMKKLGEVCDLYQPKTITANEILPVGPYKVFGANGVIGYYNHYNHEDEEVVVTCRGATCGTINVTDPRSWITGNAMVVHPKSPEISKTFLKYALLAADLSVAITGTAQPQITRSSLAPLSIALPDLADQRRIAARLDEQMAHANTLLRALESERDTVAALPTALLREVFG